MGRKGKDKNGGPLHFAVLIPHRDCRRLLRSWSGELFAAGYWGAWSFPQAAPLALLSAPLAEEELRELARNLRRRSLEGGRDGMLRGGAPAVLSLDPPGIGPLKIYGPALELRVEAGDFGAGEGKITALFPPLLGCALLEGPESGAPENRGGFAFRAAAVANMRYRPLPAGDPAYSFSWKIGEPRWLPSCRPARRGGGG
ncbi:MAG: hypothetical protein LBH51_10610 [Treponema sp.]|jgi:hypothetical protein|nr:hypothetical protein [Treponema sp.]